MYDAILNPHRPPVGSAGRLVVKGGGLCDGRLHHVQALNDRLPVEEARGVGDDQEQVQLKVTWASSQNAKDGLAPTLQCHGKTADLPSDARQSPSGLSLLLWLRGATAV